MPTAWSRCIAILSFYENQIPSARNASQILNTMKAQVMDVSTRSRAVSQAPSAANTPHPGLRPAVPMDANGNGDGMLHPNVYAAFNLDDSDFFGNENLSEAWYGHQMTNLDWLEVGAPFGVGQGVPQYV
jgi:hypothetical protein